MINCLLNIISIIGFHGAALILISDLPPSIVVYIIVSNHTDKDLNHASLKLTKIVFPTRASCHRTLLMCSSDKFSKLNQ